MTEPRPQSTLIPLCELHVGRAASGECLLCRLERYERALNRLADPLSALTVKGMMDIAADALAPRAR